jgi:PIN domain nuclease of toxin-antitoxin system
VNLLLDTHVFLWSLLEPERLAAPAVAALEDPQNTLYLSPISTWECLVLCERGRLVLQPDATTWLRQQLAALHFEEAPLNHQVALMTRCIRLSHRDPADHFLAATARVFDLTLVTADRRLLECPDLRVLAG